MGGGFYDNNAILNSVDVEVGVELDNISNLNDERKKFPTGQFILQMKTKIFLINDTIQHQNVKHF